MRINPETNNMNREANGAVAELAGAFGVILSLIYLAKQISATSDNDNQNTMALLNQNEASSLSGVLEIYKPQIADPSVAELMLQGYSDIDSLIPVDRHRFATMPLAIVESHQTFFLKNARGATGPKRGTTTRECLTLL